MVAHLDLKLVIEKSFTPVPLVVEIDRICDIKEWLLPHTPILHDHLKAHQFKFELGEDGITRMYYKEWSTDPFWLPEAGMRILQEVDSHHIPIGQPDIIQPVYDSTILDQIETTIKRLGGYLEKSGASEWWKKWLADSRLHVDEVGNEIETGMLN